MNAENGLPNLGTSGMEIEVEQGRLNLALYEVLGQLGVVTSDIASDDDVLVEIVRNLDGTMLMPVDAMQRVGLARLSRVLPLCWSVVAGINAIGRVVVRVRDGGEGPVFVSLEQSR